MSGLIENLVRPSLVMERLGVHTRFSGVVTMQASNVTKGTNLARTA